MYLFKYLPCSDRKAASETCQSWYMAANDHSFLKKKLAVFYKTPLNDENSSPIQIFENSSLTHFNYSFYEVEISNKINGFWEQMGEHIRSITLTNCDICEKVFAFILQKCPNLETLEIQSCRELFMSGRLLEGKTEGLLLTSLENLKSLSLWSNRYLTDALFNRFISAAPALEKLNLSACSLQFHRGLVKKFYPTGSDIFQNPSESVLTFYFVMQFIAARAKNIKRLLFGDTLIDGSALKILSETKDLQLESLDLYSCDQLTNTGIIALTIHQTSLTTLNIAHCSRVTDSSLVHICNNLVNLEGLNIQRCRAVTDLGIAELGKLKKLKYLNISQCELITKEGLQKGICAVENHPLIQLDIHSMNLDQTGLIMVSEKLLNLQILDISYCFNAVTDISIQVIFKNQLKLRVLRISHCDKVSDAGLTGMGKLETDGEERPLVAAFDEARIPQKIHLGSRAEEEIVRDARRKRDVMMMCEKLSLDTYSGYSLARLKNLQDLDISACNRITDVSLTYAFNFKELAILNLSRCQQITHEGMEHLVKNCPSIENLNLIDCFNLKDDAIQIVVENLRRLKHLELRVRHIYLCMIFKLIR